MKNQEKCRKKDNKKQNLEGFPVAWIISKTDYAGIDRNSASIRRIFIINCEQT